MKHIAITDHGNMSGLPIFIDNCKAHGINPIAGCELQIKRISNKYNNLVLLANNTYYINKEDAEAQYVQRCLVNGQKYDQKYPDQPGPELPDFKVPLQFLNAAEYFCFLAQEGLKRRYKSITKEIRERFDYELDIIISSDFANYFLIVYDYTHWAHLQNIPVGSGHGRTPGSIIAYSLEMTDVDPLKYGLLFECFFNPERITHIAMLDIVMDFVPKEDMRLLNILLTNMGLLVFVVLLNLSSEIQNLS